MTTRVKGLQKCSPKLGWIQVDTTEFLQYTRGPGNFFYFYKDLVAFCFCFAGTFDLYLVTVSLLLNCHAAKVSLQFTQTFLHYCELLVFLK